MTSCRHISRSAAEQLARNAGLDPQVPYYRNAEVLCQRAQGQEPPYQKNLELAWVLEQLQRVRRDLFDKGLAPSPSQYQAAADSHAAKVVAEFPTLITSTEQLRGVSGFGKSLLQHIDEILRTGGLRELDELEEQLHQGSGSYTTNYIPPVRVPK